MTELFSFHVLPRLPKGPVSRAVKKKLKDVYRKGIDQVIDPESQAGNMIQKIRNTTDQLEERQNNKEHAPENLFYAGEKKQSIQLADHLFIRRGCYTHHAIYIGNNRVIHYSTIPDGVLHVQIADLEEFSEGKEVQCMSEKESPLTYTREEAVDRAYARMSEKKYHLLENNCEHFVRWCRSGGNSSVWEKGKTLF